MCNDSIRLLLLLSNLIWRIYPSIYLARRKEERGRKEKGKRKSSEGQTLVELSPIIRGNCALTAVTAPRFRRNHLMVNGHDADQQDRPEQDTLCVASQFLHGEKSHNHLVWEFMQSCSSSWGQTPPPPKREAERETLRRPPQPWVDAHYWRPGYPQSTRSQVVLIPLKNPSTTRGDRKLQSVHARSRSSFFHDAVTSACVSPLSERAL